MTNPAVRPPERYGDLRPMWHSTLARVLVVTLAVLGLGWVGYVGVTAGDKPVSWTDVGFVVVDDTMTTATFDVTVHHGDGAVCVVQALASDYSVVGQLEVAVQAEAGKTQRKQATILTQQPAVSAVVSECRTP